MSYLVEIERIFTAVQGLPSPVRARRGIAPLARGQGFAVVLRAGVAFHEEQLTERGWFFDTDAAEEAIENCCAHLASDSWTNLFDFRPTFELVARHVFHSLAPTVPQLSHIDLTNQTIGVKTRYTQKCPTPRTPNPVPLPPVTGQFQGK